MNFTTSLHVERGNPELQDRAEIFTFEDRIPFHESEYQRLRIELQAAHGSSHLPELPPEEARQALNDLLVRIRLSHGPNLISTQP